MRHDGLFACHVAFFVNDSQGNVWWGGGGRKVFVYICKGVRRWAGAAGDLSLVDTVAMGELQFFVPGLHLALFDSSRSGRGEIVSCQRICNNNRSNVAGKKNKYLLP